MPTPATNAGTDRLLHCSPERTLVKTVDPSTGRAELLKLFVRGSLADAQREVAIGQQLQHLDVVRYRSAEVDPATGRPCIRMELHTGRDLGAIVGEDGPPSPAAACAWLQPVAATLAAMHALRTSGFPAGLCHVDVKPGNLLRTDRATLLLDFEHARPIGTTHAISGFSGGTVEFAPPEAFVGAPPDPAFDVWSLGVTLRWLLSGDTRPHRALRGHAPALIELIAACTHDRPAARPTMAHVAERLAELAAALPHDPDEPTLQAIATGAHEAATTLLAAGAPSARRTSLLALQRDRVRLLARVPALANLTDAVPTEPVGLTAALRATQARLRRWPRHPGLLLRRLQLQHTACLLFAETLPKIADLIRLEAFDDAEAWLRSTIVLLAVTRAIPGSHRIPGDDDPRLPGPLQRDPRAVLERQLQLVQQTRQEYAAFDRDLARAEADLDLAAAEATIDALAARTGGTTAQVARRRDRLHRLGFYLERIARATANVDRLAELERDTDLGDIARFVRACVAPTRATATEPGGGLGLRSLQLTLTNLADEFPALRERIEPALVRLASALTLATDEAWANLAAATQKLLAVPVPVRPLQSMLSRLDSFRVVDAFVDQPERPRSQLLDRIESLRLKLDQARATRDRLARGAEQALSRGHWTTGLFDMERAVEGMAGGDDAEVEARQLRERLEEARKRKQEVENAQRRNIELASRHAAQQDDPACTFAERLATLQQRRDCLQFLTMHAANERRPAYDRDLRQVETQLVLEAADEAQTRLDRTDDPQAQLQLARATLGALGQHAKAMDPGGDVPARVGRTIDHWRRLTERVAHEIERRQAEAHAAQRRRQRRIVAAVAGSVLLMTTVTLLVLSFGPRSAQAAVANHPPPPQVREPGLLRADPLAAIVDLARFAADLPERQRPAAEAVLARVRHLLDRSATFDAAAWHRDLTTAMRTFAADWPSTDRLPLCAWTSECWRCGLVLATTPAEPAAATTLFALAEQERAGLAALGITLPADLRTLLR